MFFLKVAILALRKGWLVKCSKILQKAIYRSVSVLLISCLYTKDWGIMVKLTATKDILKYFIPPYFQQDLFRTRLSVGSYKETIFWEEKRGRDNPLINSSRTKTRPKLCHSVIVAELERIEIQYFLTSKTKHLYKWLVLVFSLRVRFQERALDFCCSMTHCWRSWGQWQRCKTRDISPVLWKGVSTSLFLTPSCGGTRSQAHRE